MSRKEPVGTLGICHIKQPSALVEHSPHRGRDWALWGIPTALRGIVIMRLWDGPLDRRAGTANFYTGNILMSTSHHDAPTLSAFAEVVGHFADEVAHNFSLPVSAQPEDQLKSPVGDLLRAFGEMTSRVVDWRTEVHPDDFDGRPDIGVVTDGLLNGHVELKAPGVGARAEGFKGRNRQQWERFKSLPNLIYTDGSEWSLYRSGQLQTRTRIASDVSVGGTKTLIQKALGEHQGLLLDFLLWKPVVPGTAQGVAEFLARWPASCGTKFGMLLGGKMPSLNNCLKNGEGCYFRKGMMPSLPMLMPRP